MTGADRFFGRICRVLVGVAVVGAVAGCTPPDTGASAGGCDPNGFGPFSGCGDSSTTEQVAEPVSGTCDPNGFGPLSGCHGDQTATPERDAAPDDTSTGAALDPGRYGWRAWHEAGHKAVADEYGWSVLSVWLHTDGEGRTTVWGLLWKDPQQRLTFYLAGAVAAGTDEGTESNENTKGDGEYVQEILSRYPAEEADRMEAAAQADAARIVAKRSGQIEQDAAQLLKDGSL